MSTVVGSTLRDIPTPSRTRLARGTLSRKVILEAAVRALARPGVTGVTMRALAEELGADPTAVYRHFSGKDDLLGALADHLLAPLVETPPAASWRAQLEAVAVGLHAIFEGSPGAVTVLAESPFTPATLLTLEATVAALTADGLPPTLAVDATQAVVAYVVGHATGSSTDSEGFWSGMLEADVPAEALPVLSATAAAWRARPAVQFRIGLDLLLDGVEVRAAR